MEIMGMSPERFKDPSAGMSFEHLVHLDSKGNSDYREEFMAIPGNPERYDRCLAAHRRRSDRSDAGFAVVIAAVGSTILSLFAWLMIANEAHTAVLIVFGLVTVPILCLLVGLSGDPRLLLRSRSHVAKGLEA